LNGIGEVAEQLRRCCVEVILPGGRSGGSGVIWTAGRIVTNAHVARTPRASVRFWNGEEREMKVTRRDAHVDVALLEPAVPHAQSAADTRSSATIRAGELVVAIGNPLGFVGALSTGIVHSVGPLRGLGRRIWIQAQVRLAPGNSGGPLADASGRVIGINTMVASGLGLAVPSDRVDAFLRGVTRPRLGVTIRPVPSGLLLLELEPAGAAARASLLPGDLLVGAGGRRFETADDLADALDDSPQSLRVEFRRGDAVRMRETTVRFEGARSEAA